VFPIGSDVIAEVFSVSRVVMGSGVRSAHVGSGTSAVENRQVRGIFGIFGPLPSTLWATTLIFNTNLHNYCPQEDS